MFRIQSKLQAAFAVHWFWLKAPQSTSCPKVVVPRPAKAIAIITSDLPREAAIFAGCLWAVNGCGRGCDGGASVYPAVLYGSGDAVGKAFAAIMNRVRRRTRTSRQPMVTGALGGRRRQRHPDACKPHHTHEGEGWCVGS